MMTSKLMVEALTIAVLTTLIPVGFAKASESSLRGACQITEGIYTTTNHRDYTLVGTSVVSASDGDISALSPLKLSGSYSPVSYFTTFYQEGRIEGEIQIQVDQPGPRLRSVSSNFEPLSITLEETYNGGMTIYELYCSFDVVD